MTTAPGRAQTAPAPGSAIAEDAPGSVLPLLPSALIRSMGLFQRVNACLAGVSNLTPCKASESVSGFNALQMFEFGNGFLFQL